ncbi:MAG: hypothetical protein ACREKH_00405 [Candidatus Rokuibacteriota bacterium]
MRTNILIGLLVLCCVLVAVGPAAAVDSEVLYPDDSTSLALRIGSGLYAFVFFDDAGDFDIFIHPIDSFAELLFVSLASTFTGWAFWLDFEGFSGGFEVYGVYRCPVADFIGCTVSPLRVGSLFL